MTSFTDSGDIKRMIVATLNVEASDPNLAAAVSESRMKGGVHRVASFSSLSPRKSIYHIFVSSLIVSLSFAIIGADWCAT